MTPEEVRQAALGIADAYQDQSNTVALYRVQHDALLSRALRAEATIARVRDLCAVAKIMTPASVLEVMR